MSATLSWYVAHADAYETTTLDADVSALRAAFIALLPTRARILDVGCGVGRDALAFIQAGHAVTALEPCSELARRAGERTGISVTIARVQDLDATDAYDGVWACASLLHIVPDETPGVLRSFARALVPGGVVYASYKWGNGERWHDGRFFNDQTTESLVSLLRAAGFTLVRVWETSDVRPAFAEQRWVNALARR